MVVTCRRGGAPRSRRGRPPPAREPVRAERAGIGCSGSGSSSSCRPPSGHRRAAIRPKASSGPGPKAVRARRRRLAIREEIAASAGRVAAQALGSAAGERCRAGTRHDYSARPSRDGGDVLYGYTLPNIPAVASTPSGFDQGSGSGRRRPSRCHGDDREAVVLECGLAHNA